VSAEVAPDPSSPQSVAILILAGLALIFALYVGKDVVLPIALALVLKLMLQPVTNFLCDRLRIPQAISAVLLIACLFRSHCRGCPNYLRAGLGLDPKSPRDSPGCEAEAAGIARADRLLATSFQ
jgi:hypothetical protein